MKRKVLAALLCAAMVLTLGACGGKGGDSDSSSKEAGAKKSKDGEKTIVMVAKHEGIAWFDDMRVGVDEFGKNTDGVNAYQIAPEGGDSAKQVQMVEDLISQGVDAICVVPNDPESMKPVLEKARKKGIIVVSHEASNIADSEAVDYDLEAFQNEEFGKKFGEWLAKGMDGKGKWSAIVGGLTMTTHMQWFESCRDYIKENYPDMELVNEEPYEDANDNQVAYDKTMEIMKAEPDIKGIVDFAASGAGVAQALEEKGRNDITCTSLATPSQSGPYIKSGFQNVGLSWRPADAGYVSCAIAYQLVQGNKVDDSFTVDKPGYEKLTVQDKIVYGNAPLEFTKDNVDDYNY